MCPHDYHHVGSMATPALGTRNVNLSAFIPLIIQNHYTAADWRQLGPTHPYTLTYC